jgi:DNA gyrase subunit B
MPENIKKVTKLEDSYTSKNIVVLQFPECVINSPGMYIGDVHENGKNHLLFEIISNSVDEHLAGHASKITVKSYSDGSLEVEDDGRGMPVDTITYEDNIGHKIQRSGLETIFTVLHSGAKSTDTNNGYKVSGGLHGVGASVVNALSSKLEAYVFREYEYYIAFEKGVLTTPLTQGILTEKRGTRIKFKPNEQIFQDAHVNEGVIIKNLEESAFLNSGLKINFMSEKTNTNLTFHYINGLLDFMNKILNKKKTIIEPLFFSYKEDTFECEVAMAWLSEYEDEECLAYTNNIPQPFLGSHVTGFRFGIMRSITSYINDNKNVDYIKSFFLKYKNIEVTSEDIRGCMKYIISIRCEKPAFEAQTKIKLISSFVRPKVENFIIKSVCEFLEKNPDKAKIILSKIFNNAISRTITKKGRENNFNINEINSFSIPGKLVDCDPRILPRHRELFLVEGDSAAGTTKQGKGPNQAILCLQGKPHNAMNMNTNQILDTEIFMTILAVLGINLNDFKEDSGINYLDKLRYHTIIIMADADVDGSHIRSLLLAFFYKFLPTLIEKGHIQIALPPLYGVRLNNQITYLRDEEHFKKFIAQKIYHDYTLIAAGKTLNEEEVNNLSLLCTDYKNKIQQIWPGDIAFEIFSTLVFLMMRQQSFSEIKDKMESRYTQFTIEDKTEYFLLKESTIYGINTYYIKKNINIEINVSLLKIFPLEVIGRKNQKIIFFYNPLEILEYLQNIIKKIDIQRNKGLGEMEADDLKNTCMDVKTRNIKKISLEDIDLAYTKTIMENYLTHAGVDTRKQYILDGIADKNIFIDI